MFFDASVVANRFLQLAKNKGRTLTPMQLLKLVYIAHGWMLGACGRPLIKNDVQAWTYGPVIPDLYRKIAKYRSNPVEYIDTTEDENLDEESLAIIDGVYKAFYKLSGPALSRITHKKGTPWSQTYAPGEFGKTISNDIIQDYYAAKLLES